MDKLWTNAIFAGTRWSIFQRRPFVIHAAKGLSLSKLFDKAQSRGVFLPLAATSFI